MRELSKRLVAEDCSNPAARTRCWVIRTQSKRAVVGHVLWHPSWLRYVLLPEADTEIDGECLQVIGAFLVQETADYKAARRAAA